MRSYYLCILRIQTYLKASSLCEGHLRFDDWVYQSGFLRERTVNRTVRVAREERKDFKELAYGIVGTDKSEIYRAGR